MTEGRAHKVPFAIVPEWIVLHPDLSDRAVRVWAILNRHAGAKGRAYPSRKSLGETCGCHPNTIDRAIAELVSVEALTVEAHYRADRSRGANSYYLWPAVPSTSTVTPLTLDGEGASPGVVKQEGERKPDEREKGDKPPGDPLDERANLVARAAWERKTPRPATPFVAVRKIARSLLDAGWPDAEVIEAMVAAPTISTRAVELQLSRRRPAQRRTIEQDRSALSGKVQL